MVNGLQTMNKALIHFTSQLLQTRYMVGNFVGKANELLPFKYLVVASTLADSSCGSIQWGLMFVLRIFLIYLSDKCQ